MVPLPGCQGDVVASNKDCKQDEAYRRGGKLKAGTLKYLKFTAAALVIYQNVGFNVSHSSKNTGSLFFFFSFFFFPNLTGTPRPLRQPLCPLNLDTVLWVRIYSLLLSHASQLISASPYLDIPAHRFLPDRSGKPIPSWRASSSPGRGRRRRRTAALPQPRRQGEDGEVAQRSWAWCPQKMHETQ